jgi:hypothetical protein
MKLDEFFLELISDVTAKSNARGKYNRAFGFMPDGDMWGITDELRSLIKIYRSERKANARELWASVVRKDKELKLNMFEKYQGNVVLRNKMKEFLSHGPPERMR